MVVLEEIAKRLNALLTADRTEALLRAAVIIAVGLLAARWVGRAVRRLVRRGDLQRAILAQRLIGWGLILLAGAWALQELGFKLGVLLGAAGVATVAIGFASQTSLSNVISGFFLFGERPFKIGDLIEADGVTGEVLAVDLISTKLRTFDNHYVRIPNETLLKNKVVNFTRFPIRRLDLEIPIAYGEQLDRVRQLLLAIADRNAHCLAEPAPVLFVKSFGSSALSAQFSVWCDTPAFLLLRTSLTEEILRSFEQHGIRRPYTHQVLHGGSGLGPIAATDGG
jgi:small-conductance mechanosensitive channel